MANTPAATTETKHDLALLRELAKAYAQLCAKPVQNARRELWRELNSLQPTRPAIYVRAFAWHELPESACKCHDPLLHGAETQFRQALVRDTLDDDFILEPWVTVPAVYTCRDWGVSGDRTHAAEPGGSWKMDYPLKTLADIEKLRAPWHGIDEAATAANVARVRDAIGDIVTVNVDRAPAYRVWSADLSTHLGYMRGIENFMLDMFDNPEWFHRLLAFMRDGVLRTHEQAEAAGDWGMSASENQAMAYSQELQDPAANVTGVGRHQLWGYLAAQEYTLVSPQMHDEFLLQYQLPILEPFGLAAYGCCEDLTNKIDMLRQIPNLRRIAVAPAADPARCADQIGTDYVISYRPSPADMVSYGWDEDRVRRILRRDFASLRGCHFDVTLKDVQTIEGDIDRVRSWVRIVRETIDEQCT